MRLDFQYNRLTIKDLNKILYEDFTAFASSPKPSTVNLPTQRRGSQGTTEKPKGYQEYYKNHRKNRKNLYSLNVSNLPKPKSRLNIDSETDSTNILSQIQSLIGN